MYKYDEEFGYIFISLLHSYDNLKVKNIQTLTKGKTQVFIINES